MTYKDALVYMMRGKVVVNNEVLPGAWFRFDRRSHGISVNFSGSVKIKKIIGPKEFADMNRESTNWEIVNK